MKFLEKISPEWALRASLGVMYLYSGQDIIRHPTAWYWALPGWLKKIITAVIPLDAYLKFQGAVEIMFAFALLAWFLKPKIVKWVAFLSALEFAAILALAFFPWSEANFSITFRDIGLLGASLALFLILHNKSRGESVKM